MINDIEIITLPETAKILRVSQVTMRKWVRQGRLPHLKLGSRVMLRKKDILDFIEKNYHSV